jgi:aspartyl-tRNA(Asn)/glutamyl-tRNA(Gln) amidotransferase subunit A
MDELHHADIVSLAPLLRDRKVSPVELARWFLERIERLDPVLHAFITVDPDGVLAQARAAEQAIAAGGYRGPLHGIPVAHKDVFWTRGLRTTAHSGVLRNFVPDEDATIVARLAAAGAITLGKANTHEFACGGMEFFGFACNAWDPERVPGGSSSGPATALAAQMAVAATGSDTGGSIRLPASFSGVVGFKPTYGRVGRHGLTVLSWHMDHPGPLARSVTDAALVMNAIAGHDPKDPSSARLPVPDFTSGLGASLSGVRLGVPRRFFFEDLHPDVGARVEAALGVLQGLGATLEEVTIPHVAEAVVAHYVIAFAEAASVFEKELTARPQDFGPTAFHRISQGRFFTAAEYLRAMRVREVAIRETQDVFTRVDAVVSATTPYPAYRRDEFVGKQVDVGRLTRLANLTGQPSISVPCGFTRERMPVGLQVTGRAWDESTVLRIAHAYEQATPWHTERAPLTTPPAERPASAPAAPSGPSQLEPDLAWLRSFASAAGIALSDLDLEGIGRQVGPLKAGLERMRSLDLGGAELPLWFLPPGTPPGAFGRD